MRKFYLLLILLFFTMQHLTAQTIETFESVTTGQSNFISNGKTFNLTNTYVSFTTVQFAGLGYNGSNRFIQVADGPATQSLGQTGFITAATGSFKLNNLWIYLTGNSGQNAGVTFDGQAGSVTLIGKLAGVQQFSIVKNTTGLNTGLSLPGNGFIPVNFATDGAANYTNINIDQLEIKLSANYDYFAIDNFTWVDGVNLPTVTTTTATDIGSVKATIGGNVTSDGGAAGVERGIVWATTANPTIANNKVQNGNGAGTFSGIVTGLTAGTTIHYRAYATNSAGTSYGTESTFTTGAALSTSGTSQTNILCNSAATGAAGVTASGGKTPYSYSWSPSGGTGATASSLVAGTYTVTITDGEATQITRSFNIIQPPVLNGTSSTTPVSCFGGSNGTATITPTGGAGGYTFLWSNGATTATASGLLTGTYSVTITDANSCTKTVTGIMVGTPAAALDGTPGVTNVSCFEGSNGVATITPSGGTPGYTYLWNTGATTQTITGLVAGTYSVTITDANACTKNISGIVVGEPTSAIIGSVTKTDVSCNGGTNGTATASATGGTPGYTYSWSPAGGNAAVATGLVAGTYTVTITDANSCQTTQTVTITQPSALIATPVAQTNIGCRGQATGSATVSATGGTGAYTYSWSPSGGTAATATGLVAGTYTVTVKDANLCQTTQSFSITQPAAILSATTASLGVSCFGGSNGAASVTVSGGTPSYTYLWAPLGGTASSITGRPAGNYSCTITDANGCTLVKNITISTPSSVSITASKTDVSCNGGANGSASITVSGGTPGYTYSWAPSGGNAAIASGLSAGTYTVTVTDANTCTYSETVTINEPAALTAMTSSTNVLCNGQANGTASVIVSGGTPGYTYLWSPSGGTASTATGLAAGSYSCLITDANGCILTKTFTILQPNVLNATTTLINATCVTGGQAAVGPVGGTLPYTYLWYPSEATTQIVTGLATGNYSCLITDANGCTVTKNFTVTSTNTLVATTSQSNILCNGSNTGSATVVPSGAPGPFTYVWAPSGGNAATASNLFAGNYSVTITAANGCSIVKNFTIVQPSAMVVTPSQTNILCNGTATGAASVSVTGGTGAYTYAWAPSGGTAATATGLTAGNYTVTVTDANLCQTTQSFTITEPDALTATIAPTNVSCNGGTNGSATVTTTGGTGAYTYAWAPSGGTAATATGLSAGIYTVTVTDANSCTTTQSVTITEPSLLTASSGGQTDITCNGLNDGSATVIATGGTGAYTYSWSPAGGTAETATGLSAGTYTVTVTDANTCTVTQSFTITEPTVLTAAITGQTDISCNGGTTGAATVTATGGAGTYTYIWSPSGGIDATATGLTAETYTVTVTDANSCTTTQSVTITEPNALTATIAPTNVSCNGGTNGSATVTTTGGTGAYTYAWAPSGGTAATATGLTAGTYTVTVTDANSCTTSQSVTITEPTPLIASAGGQTNVSCNGLNDGSATVTATGGTGAYTYSWSPAGGTAATATGLSPGTYTVTVTDANTCTATQSFTITEPTVLTAAITGQTDISCNGGTTGAATVTATGGAGTYTYIWSPSGGTDATATGLTAGTYTVTVTDANSCTTTQSVTITEPNALTATIAPTNVSCNGGTNGSATVTTTGGTGAYTYAWAPSGGTAATATGLTAGTYTVTVTDANSCTTSQSVTITEPTPLIASAGGQTNVSCHAGSNGTATVNVTGGTGPYTYAWTPSGGNSATASGLNAGTYTVTVTDANNCTATQIFNITEPNLLASNITSQTNVSCSGLNNGSVIINVTGGVTPYTYLWSNGSTTKDSSGLAAGTYTLTITDANTCSVTQSVTITTIPDVTPPVPTVANLPEITGYCAVLSSQIPIPTATDNCAGIINATTASPLNYTIDGNYVITWRFDDGNGNISTQNQTVKVMSSPINQVTFDDSEFTFDGNLHTVQVTNLPAGASVVYNTIPATGTNNGATTAGIYAVTATISPSTLTPNCSPVILTANLTIKKAAQQITFGAIAPRILGGSNDFNLQALASSGLPIRFTFTYTSALPPANVSPSGVVNMLRSGELLITAHQDGNENYLPAADISQLLIIKNNNITVESITIGSKVYNNPAKDITYLMSCGENNPNVAIVNQTNATITPAANFSIATPKPGIYTQNVTITSQDGTATANYTIKVEKPFAFYDIVKQKFNNILLVNNNPLTNGGYVFVAFQWFKNGQLVGTGPYYSAGNELNSILDTSAIYSVKMTTLDGRVLQTCDATIVLQNTLEAKLYPNPIEVGKVITVEADFPEEELQNMQITLYSVSGKLIKTVQSSSVKTEIQLPETTGSNMYLVVLETGNIKKSFKVIVK